MSRSFQKGPQGVRGDRQSGSKVSNLTPFQPFYSATEKVYNKYYDRFKNRTLPLIKIEPTHEDFIFPVSMHDIDSQLKKIPRQFTEGIKAIEADDDCYGIEFGTGAFSLGVPISLGIGYLRSEDDRNIFYISFGIGI